MPAQSRKAISAVPPPEEGPPSHLTTRLGYVGLDVSQAEVVACLLLPDGREAVRRWSAHADVIGLTVPWYGLDRDAQIALFRDVLHTLRRM